MTEATLLVSSRIPIDGWQSATIMMDIAIQQVFARHNKPQLSWNASQLKIVGPLRLTPLMRLVLKLSPANGERILEEVKAYKLRKLLRMWPDSMNVTARWGDDPSESSWREAVTIADDYEDSGARASAQLKVGAL